MNGAPSQVDTFDPKPALENAIAAGATSGGSTNIVLHLLAVAREMGVSLSIDELYALGYEMYVEPTTLTGVAANAMWEAAQRVRATGRSDEVAAEHGNLYDHLERWMDVAEVRRIRASYVKELGG